jgi:hypothetical protein
MFDQVMARIVGKFRRVEPRTAARAYLLRLPATGLPTSKSGPGHREQSSPQRQRRPAPIVAEGG